MQLNSLQIEPPAQKQKALRDAELFVYRNNPKWVIISWSFDVSQKRVSKLFVFPKNVVFLVLGLKFDLFYKIFRITFDIVLWLICGFKVHICKGYHTSSGEKSTP